MYNGKTICVVVPAYNEERQIAQTLTTLPAFVDRIIVVDDCSRDRTAETVERLAGQDARIVFLRHAVNGGAGAAARTGYIWCRDNGIDIAVHIDGDGQMDPADMPALVAPVAEGRADFAKGNRLFTGEAWKRIPRVRYIGNSILSFLTKIACGYWHVADSQTGYTAMGRRALRMLPLDELYPRYGFPNDLLVMLNTFDMRVADVPVRPVYHVGEQSKMKVWKVVFTISRLLVKLFFRRLFRKYVIRDFHPLVLFYLFGIGMLTALVPLSVRLVWLWVRDGHSPPMTALAILFVVISGMQALLFAMLFDMEANRELKVEPRYDDDGVPMPESSPEQRAATADRQSADVPS